MEMVSGFTADLVDKVPVHIRCQESGKSSIDESEIEEVILSA